MIRIRSFLKNQKGLTLVELLAVIVILGIIAAIAVPAVANIIDNSRKDAHVANAESLYNAARLAVVSENLNADPEDEDDFWTFYADDTATDRDNEVLNLVDERYLDSGPQNPEGDGVYSEANVEYNGEEYTVTLDEYFGEDGKTITEIRADGRDALEN
ncbi:type II secretion system protein [Salisediminibacterium beveridgei]|uniref:Type IV pilin PilA n=1 Tax=Salisediminibacterium beveridgei TaxID=632773 RepID=A0A1D7QTJ7_9BACI|nr:prepilin-type N-terminal cleavage/methylation domain-containing protein [Salisediminibacterium beveridgei]AOM82353.1 Type IV pilin PilA [Salisediminibacterium beveridgei]